MILLATLLIAVIVTIPVAIISQKEAKFDASTTSPTATIITSSSTTTVEGKIIHFSTSNCLIVDSLNLSTLMKWKQNGMTIVAGNGRGNQLNQLHLPMGFYIDDDDDNNLTIYIADANNNRIMEWKSNGTSGRIVAGGNGYGNQLNQLDEPTDVIVDRSTDSIIICDKRNHRIMRWHRQNTITGEILLINFQCQELAADNAGYFYASSINMYEIRRWKGSANNVETVADGVIRMDSISTSSHPGHIYVDKDGSIYASDRQNHVVIKWMKNSKQGLIVAGENRSKSSLARLDHPRGLVVDRLGNIYITDSGNHRVICWMQKTNEIRVIVGGNGKGNGLNQLQSPSSLFFDKHGHLYVLDTFNSRVQKYLLDTD